MSLLKDELSTRGSQKISLFGPNNIIERANEVLRVNMDDIFFGAK